jgi:hypothetical protein
MGAQAYAKARESVTPWVLQEEENDRMVNRLEDLVKTVTTLKLAVEPFLELVQVLEARVSELEEELDRMSE